MFAWQPLKRGKLGDYEIRVPVPVLLPAHRGIEGMLLTKDLARQLGDNTLVISMSTTAFSAAKFRLTVD